MLDPAHIVPLRVVEHHPTRWATKIAAGALEGAVALLLNALLVAALVQWAFPRDLAQPAPHAIEVDVINEGPKPAPGGKSPAAPENPAQKPPPAASLADAKPAPAPATPPPASPPAPPETTTKVVEPPTEPKPELALNPTPPPAAPAPVEPGDNAKPHLVEAPPDPRAAARQNEKNIAANAAPDLPDAAKLPPPPSSSPQVLSSATGDEVVAEPSDEPLTDKPLSPAVTREQADNTAKLAAALPFSQTFEATPTRAAVSGSGGSLSAQYRGAVYGAFHKADDVVQAARAKHMRGQAVVAFTIDDNGGLKSLDIAVSSGNPEVDAAALEIIRRSAPFPPPPPGAQHAFSPAIGFGLDEP